MTYVTYNTNTMNLFFLRETHALEKYEFSANVTAPIFIRRNANTLEKTMVLSNLV